MYYSVIESKTFSKESNVICCETCVAKFGNSIPWFKCSKICRISAIETEAVCHILTTFQNELGLLFHFFSIVCYFSKLCTKLKGLLCDWCNWNLKAGYCSLNSVSWLTIPFCKIRPVMVLVNSTLVLWA